MTGPLVAGALSRRTASPVARLAPMLSATTLLLLLLPACLAAQGTVAQRAATLVSVRENPTAHPALRRPVPASLSAVSLDAALSAIADAAGIGISWSRDALPDVRVSLTGGVRAGDALNRVLAGTGLEALVSPAGNVAIAPVPGVMRAQAQAVAVRGRILEQGTGRPLQGVFVVLLDSAGTARAGVLSSAEGWYSVRAPSPGRYRLRHELLGYATWESPLFGAGTEGSVRADIHLAPAAISLESIEVAAADSRCRLPRDIGAETYRVWAEARKGLAVAAWADRDAGMAYQVVQHEFSRDVVSGEVLADRPAAVRVMSGVGRSPFISAGADELASLGYVRGAPEGGYMYYGIDAATLLSPLFLENYCFRVRLPHRDSNVVGLTFEPVAARNEPDVSGVLWLDRSTLEIRFLEYEYTAHPAGNLPLQPFGGRVSFSRLPNGAWIIGDWWIRMPESGPQQHLPGGIRATQAAPLQVLRAAGLTIREAGGSVRFAGAPDGSANGSGARHGGAAISGVVFDSTRMRPLPRATVFVEGTSIIGRADAEGRFVIAGLPDGEHRIGFFHPRTDSLALPVLTRPLVMSAGQADGAQGADAGVLLGIPAGAACPSGSRGEVQLIGFVVDRTGAPSAGTLVAGGWSRRVDRVALDSYSHGATDGARQEARAITDADGRFLLCGLPPAAEVQLQAGRGRALVVTMPRAGVLRQDLVLR